MFINLSSVISQNANSSEQIVMSKSGKELRASHIHSCVQMMVDLGLINEDVLDEEIGWITEKLMVGFTKDPSKVLKILDLYSANVDLETASVKGPKHTSGAKGQVSMTSNSNSLEVEYKTAFPTDPVTFHSQVVSQIESLLYRTQALKNRSENYGGYGGMSLNSSSSEYLYFCEDGIFVQTFNSSISGGGENVSVIDKGDGTSLHGKWDVAEANGIQYLLIYLDDPQLRQGATKGFVPMRIVHVAHDIVSLDMGDGDVLNFRLEKMTMGCR